MQQAFSLTDTVTLRKREFPPEPMVPRVIGGRWEARSRRG
ncbi:hypothetical protein [[Pantoea] beijingensis]